MNELKKKFIDISPLISEKTAVFPGDKPFSRQIEMDFDQGHNIGLSNITTTVHIGAHTDAPNHYTPAGESIDQRDLSFYLGSAQVITVKKEANEQIDISDINCEIKAPRVLFKTLSFPNPDNFNKDFVSLTASLVDFLHNKGVVLVGIDTPSIDHCDSKDLPAHKAIAKNNMAILEGIILNDVEDDTYELIALPLKIKDADASPVRAILVRD